MESKLGRGLGAIFASDSDDNNSTLNTEKIDINLIIPNKDQPRQTFEGTALKELADSLILHGIIQPLVVRRKGNEYELLAGERRLRAAKMAGITEVPVRIIECSDEDVLTLSLIENIQRSDLNAIEEAEALKNLIEERNCTQENLAHVICKSRSYITNSLRLLTLPETVKKKVIDGELSSGHAKVLVGLENAEDLAALAVQSKLSVRALEQLIKKQKENAQKEQIQKMVPKTAFEKYVNPDEKEIGDRISASIGLRTKLKITNNGGVVSIYCTSCEELESLTQTLLSIGEGSDKKEPTTTPSLEWI